MLGETLVFPSRKISSLKWMRGLGEEEDITIKIILLVFSYWVRLDVLTANII